MDPQPIELIEEHQDWIRRPGCDRRLRLVFIISPNDTPLTPRPALLCARSESCIICSAVIEEFRDAGLRVVDVGVLSPAIEVDDVRRREAAAPAAAGGGPQ